RMKPFSIKIKIAMVAVLICLISFGVAAFFSTRWLREEIQDDYKEKVDLMATHIIHDIGTVTASRPHEKMSGVLKIYRKFDDVEEARVFDPQGEEVFCEVKGSPEARVKEALAAGESIRFNKKINKKGVESYILPIKNQPACHRCHGASDSLRGALLLSINQGHMNHYIGQQNPRFLLLFGLIALGIIVSSLIAVRKVFLNPIKSIQKGAQAIENGDFKYQIPVKSKDELGALAENFNTMAQTLQRYFKELEERNQQLRGQFLKDAMEKKEDEMRLIMTERLAALGEMASGIAHEINNPLATISACTEALLNRMEKEKIGSILFENYLRIIQEEIDRCQNITHRMLSFVRKRGDGQQNVEINEILDKTLEMVNFQGRLKGVDVLRHYQEEVPVICANEGDLRQVFLAIIANAVDAMEGEGTLVIETGTAGNSISVKISDTGPGIPPHLVDRIFDPFFTTKSEKGGTGFGLSVADKIIKENHGKIDVTSEEGKGTTFTITLPI
ncbi:MAG: ATP-binding region ATPase domain protein, partial [Deltaproteobacteria bacterium]|nr:ATP-binding region ATPase domain protein [Deltaproteobacteria bacterium]